MNIDVNKSDKIIIAMFFMVAIPLSFVDDSENSPFLELVFDSAIYLFYTFFATLIIVFYTFPKFLAKGKFVQFFVLTILLVLVFAVIINLLNASYYNWKTHPLSFYPMFYSFTDIIDDIGFLTCLLIGKKFYDQKYKLERVEKEKKESELQLLRTQIDPHFLFNNLNTVDALIDNQPKVAKNYINKLSKLYRYLITTKDEEVVTLQEELDFIQDYMFLISQRFGDGYQLEMNYKQDEIKKFLVPPGSLQTLVENAVKHNYGTTDSPVLVRVSVDADAISVENNVQLKPRKEESTGTGLSNLKSRYSLLGKEVSVDVSEEIFKISLPIIKQIN